MCKAIYDIEIRGHLLNSLKSGHLSNQDSVFV